MKRALRRAMRARRSALSDDEVRRAGRLLTHHLLTCPRLMARRAIAGYMPLGREADVSGFLRSALVNDRRVFLPRVTGEGLMEFVEVQDLDEDVTPGAFGILEPVGDAAPVEDLEAILVPGVAFGPAGERLGMGKGFYDRALERTAPGALLLGVGHAFQLLEDVPTEPHDFPLHGFASPEGVQWYSP